MRLRGDIPDVIYMVDLDVQPARLPVNGSGDLPTLHMDKRGALVGDVIFFTRGQWATGGACARRLREYRVLCGEARSPHLSDHERDDLRRRARVLRQTIWTRLVECLAAGDPVPAFGRARVELHRSGKCTIVVDDADLYLNDQLKLAQLGGQYSDAWAEAESGFAPISTSVARQVFFLIKDLAHNHYHHDPHADLLITPDQDERGDEHWRRETQYGLARLAVARRREGTALAYREALGVMAYAEAFQRHFCGWHEPSVGRPPKKVVPSFLYDFGALKSSIEASLKVREYKDATNRQTALYTSGFVLSLLGIVFATRRVLETGGGEVKTPQFDATIFFIASHPFWTAGLGLVAALFFDAVFIRQSIPRLPLSNLVGGLSRASDAIMATAVQNLHARTSLPYWVSFRWLGFAAGMLLLLGVFLMFLAITVGGTYLVYSNIAANAR